VSGRENHDDESDEFKMDEHVEVKYVASMDGQVGKELLTGSCCNLLMIFIQRNYNTSSIVIELGSVKLRSMYLSCIQCFALCLCMVGSLLLLTVSNWVIKDNLSITSWAPVRDACWASRALDTSFYVGGISFRRRGHFFAVTFAKSLHTYLHIHQSKLNAVPNESIQVITLIFRVMNSI